MERIRRELHWILLAQIILTTAVGGLVVWMNGAFGVKPSDVKQSVEKSGLEITGRIDRLTTSLNLLESNMDTKNAWIEISTKRLIEISERSKLNSEELATLKAEIGRDRFTAKDAEKLIELNGLRAE